MKNWWCALGFHDWERVKSRSESQLEALVQESLYFVTFRNERYWHKKVCVNCGKIKDDIQPELDARIKEKQVAENRKERAEVLCTYCQIDYLETSKIQGLFNTTNKHYLSRQEANPFDKALLEFRYPDKVKSEWESVVIKGDAKGLFVEIPEYTSDVLFVHYIYREEEK